MLGVTPEPFVSGYVASKFAIRGLTASIRQERRATPGIHVRAILPAATDTPIYQKAASVFGRKPWSILPVYRAERAASAIVGARRLCIRVGTRLADRWSSGSSPLPDRGSSSRQKRSSRMWAICEPACVIRTFLADGAGTGQRL
ncbi:SDR family NAD(P)-dependent oxidoreductase [Mesorhizobium sp. M0340]|uniref:SDR family NAD(P)-dependent oxidoreductase n=1 Tax=Mesorhizobium sp. M0340 TaxID=2956939 RepID=UPI00333B1C22